MKFCSNCGREIQIPALMISPVAPHLPGICECGNVVMLTADGVRDVTEEEFDELIQQANFRLTYLAILHAIDHKEGVYS